MVKMVLLLPRVNNSWTLWQFLRVLIIRIRGGFGVLTVWVSVLIIKVKYKILVLLDC